MGWVVAIVLGSGLLWFSGRQVIWTQVASLLERLLENIQDAQAPVGTGVLAEKPGQEPSVCR